MPVKNIGHNYLAASSVRQAPLGLELETDPGDGTGPQIWKYIQNDSGADTVVGQAMGRKDGTSTYACVSAPAAAPPVRVVGFCQYAIPNQHYGWVMKRGNGNVLTDATGVTINTPLIIGDAGKVDTDGSASAVRDSVGWAFAAIAANTAAKAFIRVDG